MKGALAYRDEEDAMDEMALGGEEILGELIQDQRQRVRRKVEELRTLKRELQYLNVEETDLRKIFAAERTRFHSLPRFWTIFLLLHLGCALNAWHRIRLGPYASNGSASLDIPMFVIHFVLFLMFWRRLYYPGQRFNVPLSLWVLCMHYFYIR